MDVPTTTARPIAAAPGSAAPAAPPAVPADERVVVVGAGPAGMATAIELAQRGIPSVVLEKRGAVAQRDGLFNVSAPMADRLAALDPHGSLTSLLVPTERVRVEDQSSRRVSGRTYQGPLSPDPHRSRGDIGSLVRASSPRVPNADHRRWSKVGIGDLENALRHLATSRHRSLIELRPGTQVAEIRQGDGWAEAVLAGGAGAGPRDAVRGALLVDASGADLLGGPRTVFPERSHWLGGRFAPPADGSTPIIRQRLAAPAGGALRPLSLALPTSDRTFVWTQLEADPGGLDHAARAALVEERAATVGVAGGLVQPGRTAPVSVQLWTSLEPARGRVLKVGDSVRAPYFLTSTGAAAALVHDAPRAVDAIEQVLQGGSVESAVGAYAASVEQANRALLELVRPALLADLGIPASRAGAPTMVHRPPAGASAAAGAT